MTQLSFTIPLGCSEANRNDSLQRLLENIQVITREENFAEKIEGRMESLEDKFSDMAARIIKCEDQAGTVEDVLERLNRLSESIEALEGDSKNMKEREVSDVTELRDMLESLNAESRGIIERIDDMDKTNTSFSTQQESANKENLSLLEESLLKHEEHAADLTEMKLQLKNAARQNAVLSSKLQEVGDKYEDLARSSTERQEKSEQIQHNQSVIIEALLERIKLLESQLSNASSPFPFSPTSTSDQGEDTRSSKSEYSRLEKENEDLAKRIDLLQTENTQLKEERIDEPLTDEEILESSSEDEVSLESLILPKPVLSVNKPTILEKEIQLKKQTRREKINKLQLMIERMREQNKGLTTRVARIHEKARIQKLEMPQTPYVLLVNAVKSHIERQDMVYSAPFVSKHSGHKMGAIVDFSRAQSGADSSIGVFLTMLPGGKDDTLRWPFRANFKIALVNHRNSKLCHIHSFSDGNDKAFQRPMSNRMFNLCGVSQFISIKSLLKPNDMELYLLEDRLEFHIEVQLAN